jgi:hypothetical protein
MKIRNILSLLIVFAVCANAQYIDQNITEPIDINSKSSELGITPEQLQSILNSVSSESKEGEGDPLPDAMQERFLTGAAANDNFGYTVSSAGDVNGDGYDDLIVGAPLNDAGGTDAGRAYIYYGGNIFNNAADVVLTGSNANDQFGRSVSTAGDVNGDGYSDVIVGANGFNSSTGRAYIYYGGSIMNNAADIILTGAAANDGFGNAVSEAGDVNGDGYSDVIVGATGNDTGGTDRGQAYIYFGGASMNNVADVILAGEAAGDNFGNAVSGAGDVNGDGFSDAIVGAWLNDAGGTDAGRAYIYYGGSSMDNIADVIFNGASANDWFAISLSTAGDVNGDGYADVIVGAPLNDAGGSNSGRAYIYYGGSSINNMADVVLTGAAADGWFGFSVSNAGDVNGDAFSDVIVGAFLNSVGGTNAGRAYLYWGGESMDNIADGIITGAAAFDFFGFSVSSAGDFNGDGYNDFIVGAYGNDAGGTDAGKAYLYTNTLTGADKPDEFFTGESAQSDFGWSVSNAGDVNGDGYTDIIVGASSYNSYQGRAYIYFVRPQFSNTPDLILTGETIGNQFGISVSSAGDLNGDGYDDVIVGAREFNATTGRAYIYLGGISMDNIVDVVLTGETTFNWFGSSVSSAGDVNGDGFSDLIVGAPYYNSSDGRAYIFYGGSSMDNIADIILSESPNSYWFGYSVSDAGDVNHDGYADVIVGSPLYGAGGQAFIYLGGSSMNNNADVILTGAGGENFGWSVAYAGDINLDGYSDVIVGAPKNNAVGSSAGRAYIYYGEASMDNIVDVTLTALAANNDFGWSVSSAGDINDDGFDDVIVGAPRNDAVGTDAGGAYIYFGNYLMDNNADIILTGASATDWFGNSVSYAGDMNKDGYADLIVGSPQNDAGGTDAGRAYLFLTSSPSIKPRIMSVKDVPNDQGGYVFVKFVRSGWDVRGLNRISGYAIEMSEPPINGRYNWVQIGTVMPLQESIYTYLAHTLYDSSANNGGSFFFRVTARVANSDEFYYSNILLGKSIDNLSPAAPFNFYANLNGNNVKLGWKANTEPDFRDYLIYRSDTPVVDDFELLGTTTDTTFTDTSPLVGNAYYYIQAYDVHDNGSPYSSDSIMAFLSANIKVFLEGAYVGGQMNTFLNTSGYIPLTQPYNTSPWNYSGTESVASIPANVTDWILVELRSTTTTLVDRRAAFLKNDGTLVDLDGVNNIKFPAAAAGDYYVVILHRNHLSVMTANPISISFNPTLYDMRTDLSKAFGSNAMKSLGGGYYGVYTADTDGSGTVNASDRSNTWNQRNFSGYYGTDVDLSGTVNAADRSAVWNNRNVSTQVPTSTDNPITKIITRGSSNE